MSLPTPENPHRTITDAYTLVYFSGIFTSGISGADRVVVEQLIPGVSTTTVKEFRLPEQQRELDGLLEALLRAFAAGRRNKAAELRKALEI